MERYEDFWEVTEAALHLAVRELKIEVNGAQLDRLMQAYLFPSVFPDAKPALKILKSAPLAILSNGSPKMLESAVHHNGLESYFAEAEKSKKCFGFVQTFDEKARRRLFELLKSQGMAMNQQVTFLSDGGDDVRQIQQYLNPESEYWLNWFHITMRITVMRQMARGLANEQKAPAKTASPQAEAPAQKNISGTAMWNVRWSVSKTC